MISHPSISLFNKAVQKQDSQISRVSLSSSQPNPDDGVPPSKIAIFFEEHGLFIKATNFTKVEIIAMYQDSQPFFAVARARGRAPQIGDIDSMILLFYWLKLHPDVSELSKTFGYGETAVRTAISRARQAVLAFLENKWWKHRPRPQPIQDSPLSNLALLVDSTSIEVYKPLGRFAESKKYWDAKNSIYAIKKQVAVMAASPYYALFVADGQPGSVHDYTIFKSSFIPMRQYLIKTAYERHMSATDDRWAVLGDSGYIGPERDTEGLSKITMDKPSMIRTITQTNANIEKARIRCPVEQFFGRSKKLWGVMREVYRWDHSHFDDDINLCILLTNEHIERFQQPPAPSDGDFERQQIGMRISVFEEFREKRKKQMAEYRARKRARLISCPNQ